MPDIVVDTKPPLPDDVRRAVMSHIGRPSPLATALADGSDGFFAPAIQAGAMTRNQALFLASGLFLMPFYRCLRAARKPDELEEGFVFTFHGRYRQDAAERPPGVSSLDDPRGGIWIASAMSVCVEIQGERLTLDRDGIRRWARRVEAVVWPEDTIVGILYTHELRAWRCDIAAAVPAMTMPHALELGPPAVAARRAALWKAEPEPDRRNTWATVMLEELAAGRHAVLEGLIVPGGRMYIPPFAVPPDPLKPVVQAANMANCLRRLDEKLGTDRVPLPARTVELPRDLAAPQPELDEPSTASITPADLAVLHSLVSRLPRQERRLCKLVAEEGKSYTQAARIMRVKRSTVKSMAKRIRRKLKTSEPAV